MLDNVELQPEVSDVWRDRADCQYAMCMYIYRHLKNYSQRSERYDDLMCAR